MTASVAKLELSHAAKCSDFLRALPDTFDSLRSEWRTQVKFARSSDDKSFDALSQLFNTHVLQMNRQKDRERGAVMFAGRSVKPDEKTCWNCVGKGHLSTKCPKPKEGDGQSYKPAMGHGKVKPAAKAETGSTMDDVMAISGDESLVGAITRVSETVTEHGAVLASMQKRLPGQILWVIDSGATDHVCNDRASFYSISGSASPQRCRTAGSDVVSKESGTIAMQLPGSKKLVLPEVMYLPSAPANLLSLGTLQQKGWKFDFDQGKMSFGSDVIRTYNVGPKGKMQRGKLHAICLPLVLPVASPVEPSIIVVAQEKDTLANWHRRLAHVGVSTIKYDSNCPHHNLYHISLAD